MVEALPWDHTKRYVIRDRDGIYGETFQSRVANLGLEQVVIAPHSPWQNAYAERFIGSLRRECLDHIIALNARQLLRVVRSYANYHNRTRTHLSSLFADDPIVVVEQAMLHTGAIGKWSRHAIQQVRACHAHRTRPGHPGTVDQLDRLQ